MAKLARRRKTVMIDGAEFLIAPLTYGQLEEYAIKSKEINDRFKDKVATTPEELLPYRSLRFWVIYTALNGALPETETPITEEDIRAQMDQPGVERLWNEIILFSGLEPPKPKPAGPPGVVAGEPEAGS